MSSEHSVNKLLGLPCPFHCSPPGRFLAMEMQGTLNLTLCIRVSYLVRLWWFEPKTLRRNRAFHSFSTTGISLPQQVCHRKRTFSPGVQISSMTPNMENKWYTEELCFKIPPPRPWHMSVCEDQDSQCVSIGQLILSVSRSMGLRIQNDPKNS